MLAANRTAWSAWLENGSREDWSAQIGRLNAATMIVAGEHDTRLGVEVQKSMMQAHFDNARLETLSGGHLLPIEAPDDVARLIMEHIAITTLSDGVGQPYRDLIFSGRVSRKTRALLLARGVRESVPYTPVVLDARELAVLRAMLARVLPQRHQPEIDLAARIDRQLAGGETDGWRFAALPRDRDAYRSGLATLDAADAGGFCGLDAAGQDTVLQRAAAGQLAIPGDGLMNSSQMKLWFEDVRADAVRLYVAHPATLSWMGYSGIGYGGDGVAKAGFRDIGVGERESWEPLAVPS